MKEIINIKLLINTRLIIATQLLLAFMLCQQVAASVIVTADQTVANKFVRHTVTGIRTPLPQYPDVPGFLGTSFLTVGDINNDGILEIVASSGEGQDVDAYTHNGEIAVFTWDGFNLDNWSQGIVNNSFAFPNEPILHDMDGDGDLDILVGDNFVLGFVTRFTAGIYWLENLGGTVTDPANWVKHTIYEGGNLKGMGRGGLMHVEVLDVDGDGKEDIVTSRVDLGSWQTTAPKAPPAIPPATDTQITFMEIFRKENSGFTQNDADGALKGGTCYGYSRHVIGDGGGFQFGLYDIDGDGYMDIYAPQYLINYGSSLIVRPDIHGDSLLWFKNPGPSSAALGSWNRYTISNDNTSCNPLGKGYVVITVDIDHDGKDELVFSTNNHQDYMNNHRIWPSGVYYLDIPSNPESTASWCPITIETGDPLLDPTDLSAVANDLYANDRPGNPLQSGSPGMVRMGDFNNDGYPDLVVAGDSKGAVYYYESSGSSSGELHFKRSKLYADSGSMTAGTAIVDIDKDGDLDIIQGIYDTSVVKPAIDGDPNYKLQSSSIFVFEQMGLTTTTTTAPPTLVTLSSFTASPGVGQITITWITDSEVDNAGFNIYRAELENGNYLKINHDLIPAQGTPTQGVSYTVSDKNVRNRKTYFYKLEDINFKGISTFHEPMRATPRLIFGLF
ncbi:MAG: VCBS repeat-containing protein [Pseudomonadota bacterium]